MLSTYLYPLALASISLLVMLLEWWRPWRRHQRFFIRSRVSDFIHLFFNGHFLGVILYGIATHQVLPHLDAALQAAGMEGMLNREVASHWPVAVQVIVALLLIDALQWGVHRLLHRVPWLWQLHKTHHSVVDGEMSWIVAFRFQWAEVVVYKSLLYLPLAFFGFGGVAVMTHAIFGTLIGHLNHANLPWDYGPLRYVLNNPKMHLWHHDYDRDAKSTVNFGIIFSLWDWLAGTAYLPAHGPRRLGFRGVERFPTGFFAQTAWPLSLRWPSVGGQRVAALCGASLLAFGWWLHDMPSVATPRARAHAAATQGEKGPRSRDATLARFGAQAAQVGYAHPEWMVSADELAATLGLPRLRILDVRPRRRFLEGHIAGAASVSRKDYARPGPLGLSRHADELEDMLRARGIDRGDTLVLYGDGPAPYRLFWALRSFAGVEARILDGGIQRWKSRGHPVRAGEGAPVARGDIRVDADEPPPPQHWPALRSKLDAAGHALLLDARSAEEFSGEHVAEGADRGGHIPGAVHLEWSQWLRRDADDTRLKPPDELQRMLRALNVDEQTTVVAYCQSGTRAAVTVFALLQAGVASEAVHNYDGSWAEYSRLQNAERS